MASKHNNNDIKFNIYVVTYNCNNMKLTGDNDNPSIKDFVLKVITYPLINNNNIFIFGIQEAPYASSDEYKHMLTTIISELNNDKTISKYYNYYYFDLLTISRTKLFIIYNDENISVSNDKYYNLSGNVENIGNKHILQANINYNDTSMVTVITTHLRKNSLDTFFTNDLKQVLESNIYKDNIILFGDLNSRTLYKAPGSSRYESYNDAELNKNKNTNANIIYNLNNLRTMPLISLTDTNNENNEHNTNEYPTYANMIYNGDYASSIKFYNATIFLEKPTYRYDNKNIVYPLKGMWKNSTFKVPSYPDRVLYKSEKIKFEDATVMNYKGSDHLPVTVKFSYNIKTSTTMKKIYFMRHGHSCSNFIKYSKDKLSTNDLKAFDNIPQYKIIIKGSKVINKAHTILKNPNLSYDGYLKTQKFVNWRASKTNNAFNLNNKSLIVFCSPLVRAMETAYLSYPYEVTDTNNNTYYKYRTFSYKYYNLSDDDEITDLDHKYIYVIPFIKELSNTPDNKLPTIDESIVKFKSFIEKLKINIITHTNTLAIPRQIPDNLQTIATDIPDIINTIPNMDDNSILYSFINKLKKTNNYIFVSHNKYLQKTLKMIEKIHNTMIITQNKHLIYKLHDNDDNINTSHDYKQNMNRHICMKSSNINTNIIFINI